MNKNVKKKNSKKFYCFMLVFFLFENTECSFIHIMVYLLNFPDDIP